MKRLLVWAPLFLIALSGSASADNGATDVVLVGAVGAGAGTAMGAAFKQAGIEPSDWINPALGTTSALAAQCDVNLETRLLSTPHANVIFVGLKNDGKESVIFKPLEVRLEFGNGLERSAAFPTDVNQVELKHGWRVMSYVPAPDKYDFKKQDSLTVSVPLWKSSDEEKPFCTIKAQMQRDTKKSARLESFTDYTVLDEAFEFGRTFGNFGKLSSLGSPAIAGGLAMSIYFGVHHGVVLGLTGGGYGSSGASAAVKSLGSNLSVFGVYLGYAYRSFFARNWSWSYEIAPAVYGFSYRGVDGSQSNSTDAIALHQQLNVDWTIARVRSGFFEGSYGVGIGLYDLWSAPIAAPNVSVQGNQLGALLRLKLAL